MVIHLALAMANCHSRAQLTVSLENFLLHPSLPLNEGDTHVLHALRVLYSWCCQPPGDNALYITPQIQAFSNPRDRIKYGNMTLGYYRSLSPLSC